MVQLSPDRERLRLLGFAGPVWLLPLLLRAVAPNLGALRIDWGVAAVLTLGEGALAYALICLTLELERGRPLLEARRRWVFRGLVGLSLAALAFGAAVSRLREPQAVFARHCADQASALLAGCENACVRKRMAGGSAADDRACADGCNREWIAFSRKCSASY